MSLTLDLCHHCGMPCTLDDNTHEMGICQDDLTCAHSSMQPNCGTGKTHSSSNLLEYININILYFHHLDHCDCGTACTMPDGWPGFCNMEQTCIHSFMPPDCGPGKNTKNRYIFLSKIKYVRKYINRIHFFIIFNRT